MTRAEVVAFLVKEYDIEEKDATPAVDSFMMNELASGLDDVQLEVSDIAEYIYTNSKYWKNDGTESA